MDRQSIIDLIGQYVRLRLPLSGGDDLPAYCPFHKGGAEDTPSFYVYVGPTTSSKRTTGSSFCHTCGRGWHLSTLLRQLGNSFQEVSTVTSALGLYDEATGRERRIVLGVDKPLDLSNPLLPEWLLGIFDYCPRSLLCEGFEKRTLHEFGVGFDLMRSRITYPLRDHRGRLVGISGRTVGDNNIRYKIYSDELDRPHYEIHKGRLLWNLHQVREEAAWGKAADPLILCEGFKAVMWLSQAGYRASVCGLGTAVTDEQIALLSAVSDRVLLFLDDDDAGLLATAALLRRLQEYLVVTVARYPAHKRGASPDDLDKEELDHSVINCLVPALWKDQNQGRLREIKRRRRREQQRR